MQKIFHTFVYLSLISLAAYGVYGLINLLDQFNSLHGEGWVLPIFLLGIFVVAPLVFFLESQPSVPHDDDELPEQSGRDLTENEASGKFLYGEQSH